VEPLTHEGAVAAGTLSSLFPPQTKNDSCELFYARLRFTAVLSKEQILTRKA